MKKLVIFLYSLYTLFTYIVMGVLIMIWQQKDMIMVGRDCNIFWIAYGVYCFITALCWGDGFRKIAKISSKNKKRIALIMQVILSSILGYKMLYPICKYGIQLDRSTLQKYGVETRWMFTFLLLYIVNNFTQRKL